MGGTDDPSNLVEVSVEQHAELHLSLYLEHGLLGDWYAFNALSGITEEMEKARVLIAHTPEANRKRSKTLTGRNYHGGRRSEEDKRKISEGTRKAMAKLDKVGRPPKRVLFNGVLYHSIKEMSSALGMSLKQCYDRIYKGKASYQ